MPNPKNYFAAAAEAIRKGEFSSDSLSVISKIITDGNGKELLEELFQQNRKNGLSEADAVYKTMPALGILADHDKFSPLILMAYLWPIANDLYLHDVCDHIDLRMDYNMSQSLKDEVRKLISRETREGIRRHYEQWLDYKIVQP